MDNLLTKVSYKNIILSFYLYYILNIYKTSISFHHPLEIWLQNNSFNDYLKHPISSQEYSSKVCPLGNLVGKLFAIYIICRNFLSPSTRYKINNVLWSLILIGGFMMNLNVFIYLFPAYLFDLAI